MTTRSPSIGRYNPQSLYNRVSAGRMKPGLSMTAVFKRKQPDHSGCLNNRSYTAGLRFSIRVDNHDGSGKPVAASNAARHSVHERRRKVVEPRPVVAG